MATGLDLMSGNHGIPLSGTMATLLPSCLLLYCPFLGEASKVLAGNTFQRYILPPCLESQRIKIKLFPQPHLKQ